MSERSPRLSEPIGKRGHRPHRHRRGSQCTCPDRTVTGIEPAGSKPAALQPGARDGGKLRPTAETPFICDLREHGLVGGRRGTRPRRAHSMPQELAGRDLTVKRDVPANSLPAKHYQAPPTSRALGLSQIPEESSSARNMSTKKSECDSRSGDDHGGVITETVSAPPPNRSERPRTRL